MIADWKPIKDGLPQPGKRVLFADYGGFVCEGYVTAGGVFARAGSNAQLDFTPTHWADLPEPPPKEDAP